MQLGTVPPPEEDNRIVAHPAVGVGVVGRLDKGGGEGKGDKITTIRVVRNGRGCPSLDVDHRFVNRRFLDDLSPTPVRLKGSGANPDPPEDLNTRVYVRGCDERKIEAFLPQQR